MDALDLRTTPHYGREKVRVDRRAMKDGRARPWPGWEFTDGARGGRGDVERTLPGSQALLWV